MDRPTTTCSGRQARPQRATSGSEGHAVRVIAVRCPEPDLDRLVAALLALAMAELEAERQPKPDDAKAGGAAATGDRAPDEQSSRLR